MRKASTRCARPGSTRRAARGERLALPGQRDDIVGLKQQRLAVEADRLARQALRPCDLCQRNDRRPVARIGGERRFIEIDRSRQVALRLRLGPLMLERHRARQDIIVGALRIRGYGHGGKNEAGTESQETDAHRILPFRHFGGC